MKRLSFVIDTNILIEIEKNNKAILSKLEKLDLAKDDLYITSPTYSEFYFGIMGGNKENLKEENERLDRYKLLNTTKNSSRLLAEIKRYVSKLGIMIPTFDLFIASIVIDSGMPLVTLDKHFKRVSNLNVILLEKF